MDIFAKHKGQSCVSTSVRDKVVQNIRGRVEILLRKEVRPLPHPPNEALQLLIIAPFLTVVIGILLHVIGGAEATGLVNGFFSFVDTRVVVEEGSRFTTARLQVQRTSGTTGSVSVYAEVSQYNVYVYCLC